MATSIAISFAYCKIKNQIDHIIVGQGLAGSCLALHLLKQGKKILVLDEPEKNRASAVAAGLFNPITGKFLKHTWMAEKIFPELFRFYREAEELLHRRFFYPMPIYRPFLSIEEQNAWMAESEKNRLQKFIFRISASSIYEEQVHDPFGGMITQYSGYLDTLLFMEAVRDFLKVRNAYQEICFDPQKITIQGKKIHYDATEAKHVIFCEGVASITNPFFNWVPIRPLKGEIITIFLTERPEMIVNRGVYVVPTKTENIYRAGATYNPDDRSPGISGGARQELEGKLKDLIKIPFTINHQDWGMRPTAPDRKPILGPHPEFKNLIIFNGLGTKGVSLAPYFSEALAGWLSGHREIPFEVNIERFKSLYSKFSSAII